MLYKNGKLVDLSATSGDDKAIAEDYQKKITQYKEQYGTAICIKYKKHLDPKINPSGRMEPIPLEGFPLISITAGKQGAEEWVYTDTPLRIEDGEYKNLQRHLLVSGGEFYIELEGTEARPDLAYFVIEKHNFFNKQVIVHDVRSKARKEVSKFRTEAKLKSTIFGEGSPLVEHSIILRNVGRRWGIVDVDTKSVEEIQVELYDKVMANEERRGQIHSDQARSGIRGVEAFLEDVKYNDDTKTGAKVMAAVEQDVVKYNYEHNVWHIPADDGGLGNVLCSVPLNEKNIRNEVLITNMLADRQKMIAIENALGEEKTVEKPCELEDIDKTNDYPWLLGISKKLGVSKKVHGMKMHELKKTLAEVWKDKYLPQKVEM